MLLDELQARKDQINALGSRYGARRIRVQPLKLSEGLPKLRTITHGLRNYA